VYKDGPSTYCRDSWNKWSCKLYLEEKVQLDHSSKNQWSNIPSISKQLMAVPLFRNEGQKLPSGVPDPAPAVGSKWRCRNMVEWNSGHFHREILITSAR
jgi:hypothetical protein